MEPALTRMLVLILLALTLALPASSRAEEGLEGEVRGMPSPDPLAPADPIESSSLIPATGFS